MKILKAIHDLEFTVSGGFAVYFLMCVAYVTLVGLYQIGSSVVHLFK